MAADSHRMTTVTKADTKPVLLPLAIRHQTLYITPNQTNHQKSVIFRESKKYNKYIQISRKMTENHFRLVSALK